MNTICTTMSNTEISVSLGIICLIIAIIAIYRTAVSNKKQEKH